ncbi:unnamed protein product [Paramecium octaurelia]|uniref:Transmembrane protein n=1 Tax=Paramecium octaurelia TaxID=43137 RepID=A0A8S1WK61_PAROT|nr:unnamed protein product [Paramecium octaurelia]
MNIIFIFILAVLGYHYFHYFHLYNYEIILIGKILYINTKIKNQQFLHQLIQSFAICFSADLLFRSIILEYQDRDLPKLINSIIAHFFITLFQWKYGFCFQYDLFYNLSQAKILTWAFKNRYLYSQERNDMELFIQLLLASSYQNLLLGSGKNVITTFVSLMFNYCYQPYFFQYQPSNYGLTAYRNKHYLSQFVFYGMKLF